MKRGIYTAVLSILTIAAIIWGSAVHLFGVTSDFSWGPKRLPVIHLGSGGKQAGFTEDVEPFKNLNVDVNAGTVTVIAGTEYSVEYKGREALKPVIKKDGDELKITQKKKNSGFTIAGNKEEIIITVPEKKIIDECVIKADLGNLKIRDVRILDLETETDAGNVNVSGCQLEMVSMDADMGNINVKDSSFTEFCAELEMGNAKINSSEDLGNASFRLHADLGKIKVDGENQGNDYKVKGSDGKKVDISADLGNIKVNWN
jgi:hypothetical protein